MRGRFGILIFSAVALYEFINLKSELAAGSEGSRERERERRGREGKRESESGSVVVV